MYILCCNKCGKMYKAIDKNADIYTTDFGDKLSKCFCDGEFTVMQTQEWIADRLFTLKGDF